MSPAVSLADHDRRHTGYLGRSRYVCFHQQRCQRPHVNLDVAESGCQHAERSRPDREQGRTGPERSCSSILDTSAFVSANALVHEGEDVPSVLFGDEDGTRGNESSSIGEDSVEAVLCEQHDREIPLQEGLLVGSERDLASADCAHDLRADSECGVGEPAEQVVGP